MSFRKNKYGRSHPITPKKMTIHAPTDSRKEDEARRRVLVKERKNQESFLQRLKPNKVEVSIDPKNAYIPSAKATWNLKPEVEQKKEG